MELQLFTIRDEVSGQSDVILTAKNAAVLRRDLKAVIAANKPNPITEHLFDKRVYKVGTLFTDTGQVVGDRAPDFCYSLEELYQEHLLDIKRAQERIKNAGIELPKEEGEINDDTSESN